jgi:serine/threonine protein kinase
MDGLGRGTFGVVHRDGNVAIKTFKEPEFLIQELIILKYMKDSMYFVGVREFNLSKLEIRMDLYDMSLNDLIKRYVLDVDQKVSIFKDILKGVSDMHSLELVHCDLVTINPLRAVVCDPGLSSLSRHGRFFQTPTGFRRPNSLLTPSLKQKHDLYSISIMGVILFAGIKLDQQVTPERLRQIIMEVSHLIPPTISPILSEFTLDHSDMYPSTRSALIGVYREDSILVMPVIEQSKMIVSVEDDRYVYNMIKSRTEECGINKGKRGYLILKERFNNRSYPPVSRSQYSLYIGCIMLILSCMFGNPGFTYKSVMSLTGYTRTEADIDRVITDIVTKEALINILLMAE